MKFSGMFAAAAAATMALAPIAAQAGTRASAAGVANPEVVGAIGTRKSKEVAKDNKIGPGKGALLLLFLAGFGVGTFVIVDGDDNRSGGS